MKNIHPIRRWSKKI